jgi:hypothetical protein
MYASACAPLLLAASCSAARPALLTPDQARDCVYDQRSRAEAARVSGNRAAARDHRAAARRCLSLLNEGGTTTAEQALGLADSHARRAETLQSIGLTRFVQAELDRSSRYEEFALRSVVLPAPTLKSRADLHRAWAADFRRLGWRTIASHHTQRAETLERRLRAAPQSGW